MRLYRVRVLNLRTLQFVEEWYTDYDVARVRVDYYRQQPGYKLAAFDEKWR